MTKAGMHRVDALALVPAALTLAVIGWWAARDGGYAPRDWLPGSLFVVTLLAIVVVALGRNARVPSRAAGAALTLLVLYALWSFASIAWAETPGEAYEGSLRTVAYVATFALFLILPWTPRAALATVTAFVGATVVVAVIVAVRVVTSTDLSTLFLTARLAEPLDYHNANAALWTLAALPALVLAGNRSTPPVLRPVLLAAATLLLGLALMGLSRGWLVGVVAAGFLSLAVAPSRVRVLLFALVPAAVLLAISGDLFEPYRVASDLEPAQAAAALAGPADQSVRSLALGTLVALVAGVALVVADVRLVADRPAHRRTWGRRVGRVPGLVTAGAVVLVLLGAAVAADAPGRVDRALKEAMAEAQPGSDPGARFTSLGSGRYDIWRVALDVWRDHPVVGLGQDNFEDAYLRDRDNEVEEARWTHSLQLRVLAHTGIVGALLFFGGLLAAVVAALRDRRAIGPTGTLAGMAALAPIAMWTTHGSVDWLWEFPALSCFALALLGMAAALPGRCHSAGDDDPDRRERPVRLIRRRLVASAPVLVAAASLVVVVLFGTAWIAARDIDAASRGWPQDRAGALNRLERARSLTPLDARPALVEGIIGHRTGDFERAGFGFLEATRLAPRNWFPRFALGLLASERGQRDVAERHLRAALALTPTDPLVRDAVRRVRSRKPVTFAETRSVIGRRVAGRAGLR